MTIVFAFVGGHLNDAVFRGNSEASPASEATDVAAHFYAWTRNAELGCRFSVPVCNSFDHYEIVKCTELNGGVLVRAAYVGFGADRIANLEGPASDVRR